MGNRSTQNSVELDFEPTEPDGTVRFLLEHYGLPTEDLEREEIQLYRATRQGEIVGVGGYEIHGKSALLRSVAVKPDLRGEGYGTQICRHLEAEIADHDCEFIFLLTTSAAPFFRRLNYTRTFRADAPESIRETREFAELCPDSAACMYKIF